MSEPSTDAQRGEVQKSIEALGNNFPEMLRSMTLSANEVRAALKEHGLKRPEGLALQQIPLIKLTHPGVIDAVKDFSVKLFCALHYKHTGNIAPSSASIFVKWMTNVMVETTGIPKEIMNVVGGKPKLERCRHKLEDQFDYQLGVTPEKTRSLFVCGFRRSFVLIGLVSHDPLPDELKEDKEKGLFLNKPFSRPPNSPAPSSSLPASP